MRKIDPSLLWLVAIKNKDLIDEPYVAFAVVEANTARVALKTADATIEKLSQAGQHRCHAVNLGGVDQPFKLDHFYKTTMLHAPSATTRIEQLEAEVAQLKAKLAASYRERSALLDQLPDDD